MCLYLDERGHTLAEGFGCLGVEGTHQVYRPVGSERCGGSSQDGGGMSRKGVVKERLLLQIVSVTAQVALSGRVSRVNLQLGDCQERQE